MSLPKTLTLLSLGIIGCGGSETPSTDSDVPDDCEVTANCTTPTLETNPDEDGDGYDSIAAGGQDCDDTNAAIHPDATEVCDGVDNDCNDLIDEDDPDLDPSTLKTWYRDFDADGFGSALGNPQQACEQPSGSVLDNTDCDDDEAAVNPAAIEVPGDCIDNDCDGVIGDAYCAGMLYMIRESDGMLRRLDTLTMVYADIGVLGVNFDKGELAYDENQGVMYMVDGQAGTNLYTVDVTTGAATLVGAHNQRDLFGLAVSPNGTLYATNGLDGGLWTLDPLNAAAGYIGMPRPSAGLTWDTSRDLLMGLAGGTGDLAWLDVVTALGTWLANSGAIDDCGLAYDAGSDLLWAVDQSGDLYTYNPNNGYSRTLIQSNLGAHDGLSFGP